MTLVSITLTEGEQEVILRNAQSEQDFPPEMHEFASLAEKIRRARFTAWDHEPGGPVKSPVQDDKWTAGPDKGIAYWEPGDDHSRKLPLTGSPDPRRDPGTA